ncbi:uncharacterized protein B0P05DRAFT_122976 [Gilbertella persicaria]|uniref:uncharacterized protein n=1 Tax=Gilbertella persicaria TaxID=101096 RepID=UPI00221E5F07|nr:uncharacterized protein B0P05DRAFT_122976 [Gilbertella persicaria]KAI8078083.1 hypothetical protein B0P05DRAFT_122976 [Gilbertella persicaria]
MNMFLFDSSQNKPKPKKHKTKKSIEAAEARAAAKARKIQQDEMDALQITFYEIESWIEKTAPALEKMTKELDKASQHFTNKKRKDKHLPNNTTALMNPTGNTTSINSLLEHYQHELAAMQWKLSFQPGNSLRLETNIKSVEQLIEAVQKIQLLAEPSTTFNISRDCDSVNEEDFSSSGSFVDSCIEYWNLAMYRRPAICVKDYEHDDMSLKSLTEDVTPSVLAYICQTYWDCLHPKFSEDWSTFWESSDDPNRNQLRIDSGLAMVFEHIVRHDSNACANAQALSHYYYGRAQTLLNLSFVTVLKKHDFQSGIYIEFAYRMMHQLGIHQMSQWPENRLIRKRNFKLYMVLYYNDTIISVYSRDPPVLDETSSDVDFYEMISLNEALVEHGEANYDEKTLARETFYVHLLELIRVSKRIDALTREYQRQNLQHHHSGTLPTRWARKVQELEVALATWFDRLPVMYRVDPKPTELFSKSYKNNLHNHSTMEMEPLREQSALLLMLQYQTQWLKLHKTFLSNNIKKSSIGHVVSDADRDTASSETSPYCTYRSYIICSDAANRIVIMAEIITERFNWCACQQFINFVYQASTVYCNRILNKDDDYKSNKAMIQRIMKVLASSKINYEGLPDDLTACLNDFLAENHDETHPTSLTVNDDLLDQIFAACNEQHKIVTHNDNMFNSPHMHKQCLLQSITAKSPSTLNRELSLEAMYSIKLQNPIAAPTSIETDDYEQKNWRCKFSSFNVASNHVN